ncbi:Similar to hypothetical protein ASPNIDRAFT_45694 [Aspergillus niger ATCC 1015]; acc. no. EHA21063 [Pyronema omphalodes CBS 100304]|uniref:Nucleotidyl transferase AbiEii/AbiGii toxin family protein n=1 Tax=Pyronema omphalodes (strain CBS 100304) TaxID=1076935 RepID=U4L4V9_PYROM|nr:Similar to hypothetical protein ASPNIDRAFT_45694 [Aspergillus niger ATCC 1015]; acc. no. EHA21063 [Pyronema omphalodes CBS 100304]
MIGTTISRPGSRASIRTQTPVVLVPLTTLNEAARAVGVAMAGMTYAVVGGAACNLLGSTRATEDVDFVVPRGATAEARSLLRKTPGFTVEPRTNHTYYQSSTSPIPVQIEILTPPMLFKEEFDSTTPVISVSGVNVLKPTFLLNAKCRSVLSRGTEEKKRTDTHDILFLLRYIATAKDMRVTIEEVPNISKAFVDWFVQNDPQSIQLWKAAGFSVREGTLDTSEVSGEGEESQGTSAVYLGDENGASEKDQKSEKEQALDKVEASAKQ